MKQPTTKLNTPSRVRWWPAHRVALGACALVVLLSLANVGAEIFKRGGDWDRLRGGHVQENVRRFLRQVFPEGHSWTGDELRGLGLEALDLGLEAIGMSVLAMVVAIVLAAPTVLPAARNIALGELMPKSRPEVVLGAVVMLAVRGMMTLLRAIPDYIWVVICLLAFRIGPAPGILALGIHNAGVLSKLNAEAVEDMRPEPLRGLLSSGATRWQVVPYGVIPALLPRFVSFAFYRWEVTIRTTAILGIAGGGGIGYRLRECLEILPLRKELPIFLAAMLIIVLVVDGLSAVARRSIRSA